MFGLLNPFAFWLAPLLAAPLVIHFLGRSKPKPRDFPSLMPVRGQLTQAMRRHRLKNWLQLILRTLALLFLMLAAGNPVWRLHGGFTPPAAAGVLIHNGAYGAVPAAGGRTVLEEELNLRRGLDSLTSGHAHAELLWPDAPSREAVARFGRYPEAVARLLNEAGKKKSYHLHLPVFDWADLEASRELLAQALKQNPGLRVVLTEYPEAREHLTPFSGFTLRFPKENIAAIKTEALFSARGSPALWTSPGGTSREIRAGDSLEVLLPLSQAGWLNGTVSLTPPASDAFAYPSVAVSANIPPPKILCHVSDGNGFASLASLGKGGLRLRIQSFNEARGVESQPCDFLYLANPRELDATLLGRAGEIARGGGRVIVNLGNHSDLALLNRNLLLPLGLGRLTELKQHVPVNVESRSKAFAALGVRTAGWGDPGTVKAHVTLVPDTGAVILLAAAGDPILAYRKVGKGSLLLWTSDVDDPEWTDLGLGPWVALTHQALASGAWSSGVGLQWVASDSTFLLRASESETAKVLDPSGYPFPRVQRDPEGWRIGPFDHLGLYRLEIRREKSVDTSWLSVGLADRFQTQTEAKERFLSALGESQNHVAIRDAAEDWRNLYSGFRLRIPLLIFAALLLLLEGVVSLRLAPAFLTPKRD